MSMPDNFDEQQEKWRTRTAQQRYDLSHSVAETLAAAPLQGYDWSEEVDEPESAQPPLVSERARPANQQNTHIIPPRLSLQTKPIPALHLDMPVSNYGVPNPQTPVAVSVSAAPRLAGRSTKVLLRAIRPDEVQQAREASKGFDEEMREALPAETFERETQPRQPAYKAPLSGSGVFERGQREIAIENKHITGASSIVVTLTSDPGPVVVQYVTLHPQVGFTVHLSAPAERPTPFNYAIMG